MGTFVFDSVVEHIVVTVEVAHFQILVSLAQLVHLQPRQDRSIISLTGAFWLSFGRR